MKQKEDVKTVEMPLIDGKRGRGRPAKADALTPAERARRYRENRKALLAGSKENRDVDSVTDNAVAALQMQLLKLQMRYDLEHLTVTQLQTELATLKQAMKKPAVNPLAKQLAALKKTLAEQEHIISAYSTEINNLRDEIRSSHKKV